MADATRATHQTKRRCWRWLRYTLITVLALAVVLIAALGTTVALLQSEKGRIWLIAQVNKTGIVSLQALEGNLLDEVIVRDLVYDGVTMRLSLDHAHWRWNLRTLLRHNLMHRELSISTLEAGTLSVVSKPMLAEIVPKEPPPPPQSLKLPLAIIVDTLTLQHFSWDKIHIDAIALSLKSTGDWHMISLNHLEAERGVFQGALGVDGTAPFAVGGAISYRGTFEEHPVGFDLNIDGTLRDFHLNGHVFGEHMNIESDGRFDLFAPYLYSMFHEVTLRAVDLNPAKIFPGLPEGQFTVALDVKPLPGKLARGQLRINNAMAGMADRHRIPVESLTSEFEVQDDQIVFYELNVKALGGARIEGQGWLLEDQLRARLLLNDVNAAALARDAPKSKTSGEIWLQGPYRAPEATVDVKDALYQVAAKFGLAWVDPEKQQQLAIKDAQVKYQGATAKFSGQYDLQAQTVKAQGTFDGVNPETFGAPAGRIGGDFAVDGALTPTVDVRARYALRSSQWLAQAMTGEGEVQWAQNHLKQVKGWLQLGEKPSATRLAMEGAFGAENDALHFEVDVPDLAQWRGSGQNDLSGRVQGSGELRGMFSQLALHAQGSIAGLRVGEAKAQQTRFTVDTQWNAQLSKEREQNMLPLTVRAEFENIEAVGTPWQTVTLALGGTPARHQMTLTAQGELAAQAVELTAVVRGRWEMSPAARWQGSLSRFDVAHSQLPVRLEAPLPITIDTAGESVKVSVGSGALVGNDTRVRLKSATWQPERWRGEGTIENVAMEKWLTLAGKETAATVRGDLVLSGDWSLSQEGDALSALRGVLDIRRERGDAQLRITPRAAWQPLQLSQLGMRAEIRNARLTLQGIAESSRYGKISVDGETALTVPEGTAMDDRPFTLRVQGDIPDLSKAASLIAGDLRLTGRIHLDAQHSGTLRHPVYRGAMTGDNLSVRDAETGIALNDGEMRLLLNEQSVAIERFVFKGGRGEMAMTGEIDLHEGKPRAKLAIKADRLRLIRRPDMTLVVTGNADLGYDEQGVSLLGNLRTNYGSIQYRDSDVPSLSDDVVVIGERPQTSGIGLANVQFDVDLGRSFRLRGYGIDTKLAGTLKFRARPNQALTAFGNVRTEEGIYRAYGQKLDIRHGNISFLGALDNPAIDILAIRENSSVDAGVVVKGTAQQPTVALYANQPMSTNENLSWLLFDRGTDNMDKGDAAILFQLLNNLLAGGSGETLTGELFGGVIDEINVVGGQTEDGTATQIVTVSKRLGKNLSIGLDKSLNGLQDAVRLTWRFSRKWSMMTRFGVDDSTVDARYSIVF
ncbi:MAG: translocation/assembly module TamB domain-containing protein [Proteobacteria bacterium]|nr:translocation/assembly module TamB domain-containing protein [Pseudomonadota bacterium]MCL2307865.1 translocation/assembly module TamB domain-containing protein [Pseudomonadota bacterium]